MTQDNKLGNSLNNDHDIFKKLNFPHLKKRAISVAMASPTTTITKKKEKKKKLLGSPAASFLAGYMNDLIQDTQVVGMEDYKILDLIGFGGFSIVHKVSHLRTHQSLAVKIIHHALMNRLEKLRLGRELSIWKSLHHPRILQLVKIVQTDTHTYLLCDYCSRGTLFKLLHSQVRFSEAKAKKIFKQICQGVYYLHVDCQVSHRDLKLENILINDQGHVKLCDFGFAVLLDNMQQWDELMGGSLPYISPEHILSSPYSYPKEADIWALGVILFALVTGYLPFDDAYEPRLQQKILQADYTIPSSLSLPLTHLIRHCLNYQVNERFTIDQVLNSTWLKNV
ncbi:hypothetical protein INT47_002277 [Mucor saturninus]|uniref:Protein kinase domain-containing protein n=1 Tax=Mucor saturninus TaxID=64648 RepID=A0A8H7V1Y8_9FUNG|nr:hypothetical protein INT47_002277 [Mucor saturninus]